VHNQEEEEEEEEALRMQQQQQQQQPTPAATFGQDLLRAVATGASAAASAAATAASPAGSSAAAAAPGYPHVPRNYPAVPRPDAPGSGKQYAGSGAGVQRSAQLPAWMDERMVASLTSVLLELPFSRRAETEADLIGASDVVGLRVGGLVCWAQGCVKYAQSTPPNTRLIIFRRRQHPTTPHHPTHSTCPHAGLKLMALAGFKAARGPEAFRLLAQAAGSDRKHHAHSAEALIASLGCTHPDSNRRAELLAKELEWMAANGGGKGGGAAGERVGTKIDYFSL